MLKGSLKVIRGRKKREDYIVAATDNLSAGDREMNNGAAIGEKDSSQDNFEGNDVEESKDKFDWEMYFIFGALMLTWSICLNSYRLYFVMSCLQNRAFYFLYSRSTNKKILCNKQFISILGPKYSFKIKISVKS